MWAGPPQVPIASPDEGEVRGHHTPQIVSGRSPNLPSLDTWILASGLSGRRIAPGGCRIALRQRTENSAGGTSTRWNSSQSRCTTSSDIPIRRGPCVRATSPRARPKPLAPLCKRTAMSAACPGLRQAAPGRWGPGAPAQPEATEREDEVMMTIHPSAPLLYSCPSAVEQSCGVHLKTADQLSKQPAPPQILPYYGKWSRFSQTPVVR